MQNWGDTPALPSPAACLETVPPPLASQAWQLEPPAPHEIPGVLRHEAAVQIDGLLASVARGSGALEVTMGEALAALAEGDRVLRLGYSGIGDYARERLGIAGRTAQAMARLARELRDRPLLRSAVLSGEVSSRKAQTILPVAHGEAEKCWVARARVDTIRALEEAVRGARAAGDTEEDEAWKHLSFPLDPEGRAKLDQALELAGKLLGAATPKWQRLEAICQEYLGTHPTEEPDAVDPDGPGRTREAFRLPPNDLREFLETETQRWAWLEAVPRVEAPARSANDDGDPFQLDEELRRLVSVRQRWDELVGHLAMLLKMLGLWRELGFASLAHYCNERLGLSPRTVEQRAWLERQFHALPALRLAMRQGRLSYEKARLVAGCADGTVVDDWIERAEKTTCIALKREIESREQKQMCARTELSLRVPRRVALLFAAAFRAVREVEGRWLSPRDCLQRVAQHFINTWSGSFCQRSTPQTRILIRDHRWCQVPGCSRAAVHVHHVLYRSLGGGDEDENRVGLCAAHHLQCVHHGWMRIRGRAPSELIWELGVRPGRVSMEVIGLVVPDASGAPGPFLN